MTLCKIRESGANTRESELVVDSIPKTLYNLTKMEIIKPMKADPKQLELFASYDSDQCTVCGNPLPITDLLDGRTVCEDCESGYDSPTVIELDEDIDNQEQ